MYKLIIKKKKKHDQTVLLAKSKLNGIEVGQLKMNIFLIKNKQKNYTNQSLENLRKEKFTHLLWIIFGPQI